MSVNASATAKAKNAIKPFGPEISFIIKCSRVPDSAKSNDLREFFSGITIPFGGLVILGGAEGDAFVGFTNDESARMAMERDGNTLHGSKVSLRLSSRNEMEQLLTKRFAEIAIFSQILPTAAKKSDDDEAKRSAPPVAPIAPTPQAQPAPYKPEGHVGNGSASTNGSGSWKLPPNQSSNMQSPPVPGGRWTNTSEGSYPDASKAGRFHYSQASPPNVPPAQDYSRKPPLPNVANGRSGGGGYSAYSSTSNAYGAQGYDERKPATYGPPAGNANGPSRVGPSMRENFDGRSMAQNMPAPNVRAVPPGPPVPAYGQQPRPALSPRNTTAGHQFTYHQHHIQQEPYPAPLPVPSHAPLPVASVAPFTPMPQFPPQEAAPRVPALNPIAFAGPVTGSGVPADPISAKQHPDALYVEFSHLPPNLTRPSSLEEFLRPNVPLSLSSVKVIVDSRGQATQSLVRFGCVEDAQRALQRNGYQGIRVRPIPRAAFESAVDGSLGAKSRSDSWIGGSSPPRRRTPPRRRQRRERDDISPIRRSSPSRNDRRRDDDRAGRRTRSPERSPRGRDDEDEKKRTRRQSPDRADRERRWSRDKSPEVRRRRSPSPKRRRGSERFCVQLLNVPFRATFDDVKRFVTSAKAHATRCSRTYYRDRDVTDRWVLEFDDERDLRNVLEHTGDIRGRPLTVEQISTQLADDLYAIPEPSRRERDGSWTNGRDRAEHTPRFTEQPPRFADQPPRFDDSWHPSSGDYIPKMTLEASTEDELITRGDLPPTSFGAFSGPPVVKHGVYQKGIIRNIGTLDRPFRPDAPHDMAPPRYGLRPPLLPGGSRPQFYRPSGPGYQRMQRPPFQSPPSSSQSYASSNQSSIGDPVAVEKQAEHHLRPYLAFLDLQKSDPSLLTSLRLENVPPFTFAEKLSAFVGVPIPCAPENIARVKSGALFVNLASEAHAEEAAKHSGQYIDGAHVVTVTRIARSEMAKAIEDHLSELGDTNTLLVSDCDDSSVEEEIADFVGRFAVPQQITRRASANGAAFLVRFSSAKDAAATLDRASATELNGRRLHIVPYDGQSV